MPDTLMTKTAFAAVLGVDKSQVTRWVGLGLPVAADGRIEPVSAARWVRENVDPNQRERRSIGAAEQAGGERRRQGEAINDLQRLAIWVFCQEIPGAVAEVAAQAGGSIELVKALHKRMLIKAPEMANKARELMMLSAGETGPFAPMTHLPPPDWAALEKVAQISPSRGTRGPRS